MEEDDDFDPSQEKTLFNIKSASIKDIRELAGAQLRSLRIMHSPDLHSVAGIEQFQTLVHLNLSQNSIQEMNFRGLLQLQTLNLQSNRIKAINCEGLKRLEVLNLSYNLISSLQPLQIFQQYQTKLRQVDLRANNISDLNELRFLGGIHLYELLLNSEKRKNGVCANQQTYLKAILKFNANIKVVDKLSQNEVRSLAQNNIVDDAPTRDKPRGNKPVKENDQFIEREAELRVEVLQLQEKVKELGSQNRELVYKFECNDRYWSQKCSNLENEVMEQQRFNQELNQENKRFRKQIEAYKSQFEEQEENQKNLINKKERKDEIITQLQQRVSELLVMNGQLTKENTVANEQVQSQKALSQEKDLSISSLRSQLKEAEKALQEFHKNAVDSASQTLLRQESLQMKLEQVHSENKQIFQENAQLKRRIQELLEICREWEVKFENSQKENEQQLEIQLQQQKMQSDQQVQAMQNEYEDQIKEIVQESKYVQDQLESEFRVVLKEIQDKYKSAKSQLEEKTRSEGDLQSQLKYMQLRLQDQENVIQELQNALLRLKKEVQDYAQEKEFLRREYQNELQNKQKEIMTDQENMSNLIFKYQQVERECRVKGDELLQLIQENEKLKGQLKAKFGAEQMVEELQTNLTIKNKMLDDKNETIEELKQQLNQLKNAETNQSEDYQKLLRRYEKQSQIIEDLENQVQQLQDDYDEKCRELKNRKQLIVQFEKELEEFQEKLEGETNGYKQQITEKDANIMEMVKLLDEAKENIRRKEERMKELGTQYQQLDRQLQNVDRVYEQQLTEKDELIKQLRGQLGRVQEELLGVQEEKEKQRRIARESLQQLNRLLQ